MRRPKDRVSQRDKATDGSYADESFTAGRENSLPRVIRFSGWRSSASWPFSRLPPRSQARR